jgi:hypothetical protein
VQRETAKEAAAEREKEREMQTHARQQQKQQQQQKQMEVEKEQSADRARLQHIVREVQVRPCCLPSDVLLKIFSLSCCVDGSALFLTLASVCRPVSRLPSSLLFVSLITCISIS